MHESLKKSLADFTSTAFVYVIWIDMSRIVGWSVPWNGFGLRFQSLSSECDSRRLGNVCKSFILFIKIGFCKARFLHGNMTKFDVWIGWHLSLSHLKFSCKPIQLYSLLFPKCDRKKSKCIAIFDLIMHNCHTNCVKCILNSSPSSVYGACSAGCAILWPQDHRHWWQFPYESQVYHRL